MGRAETHRTRAVRGGGGSVVRTDIQRTKGTQQLLFPILEAFVHTQATCYNYGSCSYAHVLVIVVKDIDREETPHLFLVFASIFS